MTKSVCECRPNSDKKHSEETHLYSFDLNAQPSGHGSYTVRATVKLCTACAEWFKNSHVNAWRAEW